MKKILVPTDFSVPAENAARYAVQLAKALNANILLCNAIKAPADTPIAAQVTWPLMDYPTLKEEVTSDLDVLVQKLCASTNLDNNQSVCPRIAYESARGNVHEVVSTLVKEREIDLVVMGMAGAGGVIQFLLGSNSKEMIEKADFPILLVPYVAGFKKIRKIVFATNLDIHELGPLKSLINLATLLDAEITITHITYREIEIDSKQQYKTEAYMNDVVAKIDHPKVKYEKVWNTDFDSGLNWIIDQQEIDMVAIVHHRHHILEIIFSGSHTQRLSRHTEIPLLVFPPDEEN
ncbi:universal stress protein [Pedobacter sp. UYP1]|uniref:universal stress protein n=1 Tax=Pedobacter sp. UYP1 TaxID=1756396 RepID=UPI0033989A3F